MTLKLVLQFFDLIIIFEKMNNNKNSPNLIINIFYYL